MSYQSDLIKKKCICIFCSAANTYFVYSAFGHCAMAKKDECDKSNVIVYFILVPVVLVEENIIHLHLGNEEDAFVQTDLQQIHLSICIICYTR